MEFSVKYMLTLAFDSLFALIVTWLVAFVWRIIWDVQDLSLEKWPYTSSLISMLIYFVFILYIKYKQVNSIKHMQQHQHQQQQQQQQHLLPLHNGHKQQKQKQRESTWQHKLAVKLFTLAFAFANINHWRGWWYLTTQYTYGSAEGMLSIGALAFLGLLAMKRVCAIISVPYTLNRDSKRLAYQTHPTAFVHTNNAYLSLDEHLNVI